MSKKQRPPLTPDQLKARLDRLILGIDEIPDKPTLIALLRDTRDTVVGTREYAETLSNALLTIVGLADTPNEAVKIAHEAMIGAARASYHERIRATAAPMERAKGLHYMRSALSRTLRRVI